MQRTHATAASWLGILALLLSAMPAAPAWAEGFLEGYGGMAFTDGDRATISPNEKIRTEYKDSAVGGGRAGMYFDDVHWIGAGLDVSWYAPEGKGSYDGADYQLVPISILFLGRLPLLTSDERPHGLLQPYVGVGPSFVVSTLNYRPTPKRRIKDDTQIDVGLDVRGGVAVVPLDWLSVFVEYRYLYVQADHSDNFGPVRTEVDTSISSNLIQAGIGLRF